MRIDAANLLAPEKISHPEIRAAAEKYAVAGQTVETSRKGLRELQRVNRDGTSVRRVAALEADADEAAAARAAGKPAPKRHHLAEYEKKLETLEHDALVTVSAHRLALKEFQAVVDEHQDAYGAALHEAVAEQDRAWDETIERLLSIHRRRAMALVERKNALGGDVPPVNVIRLKPAQLREIALAQVPDQHNQRAMVMVDDVIEALKHVSDQFVPPAESTMPIAAIVESMAHAQGVARAQERAQEPVRMREQTEPFGVPPDEDREAADRRRELILASIGQPAANVVRRERASVRRAELMAEQEAGV